MKNMEEPATQKILKSTARTKINTEYTQWIAKQQKIGKKRENIHIHVCAGKTKRETEQGDEKSYKAENCKIEAGILRVLKNPKQGPKDRKQNVFKKELDNVVTTWGKLKNEKIRKPVIFCNKRIQTKYRCIPFLSCNFT